MKFEHFYFQLFYKLLWNFELYHYAYIKLFFMSR